MNFKNINLLGLNTYASHRVTEKNYLLDCNNIVADQLGVIGTRRGQQFLGSAYTLIKQIFSSFSNLYLVADDKMYFKSGSSFSELSFPDTVSFNPNSGNLVQYTDQNNSIFFNGLRISDETGNPEDTKIKKSVFTGNANNAGLEPPINVSIEVDTSLTTFAANDSIRIRIFYQYVDIAGFLITSPVSESVVGFNDSGSPCGFLVKFQIPPQYNDRSVDVYYAVSNTVNNFTPDDNLFWGTETRIVRSARIDSPLNSVYSFNNIIPRTLIINPVDLYTNASQEGILQNNDPPLSAYDIETYSGYTFYGNVRDRSKANGFINYLTLGSEVMTINGITYERGAVSDYAASPVVFSGADTVEASYDLARAITATQTLARANIISQDLSNMGEDVGWLDGSIAPFGAGSCVRDNNGNIYIVNSLVGGGSVEFYVYNPIGDTLARLKDIPETIEGNVITYVETTTQQYIYSFMGLTSTNTQAPVYKYNIRANTWEQLSLPPAVVGINAIYRPGIAHELGSLGNAYIIGGFNYLGTNRPIVYTYDMAGDVWLPENTVVDIPTAGALGRIQPACVAYRQSSPNTQALYVFGGDDGTNPVTASFKYDLLTSTWSSITALPVAKAGAGACICGGVIAVTSGFTLATAATDTCYLYDVQQNNYTNIANMNAANTSGASAYVDGVIYVIPPAGNNIEAYRLGGITMIVEPKYIPTVGAVTWQPQTYIARPFLPGSRSATSTYNRVAGLMFSKQGQPEAVPFFNSFEVGSASAPIKRIAALRSSLIILKTDGLYQLNGVSPETFGLQQLDPTCQIIAAQSLAKLENEIYCLTSEGVVAINESGARVISYQIKDLIDAQLYSVPEAHWDTAITGTAYDIDYKYILTIGDKTFTYNYITQQWTIWHAGNPDIVSWTTFNNKLYYATTTRVLEERKTFTSADYQDENGDGIDASMEFNNLEFSPGRIVGIQAMQILQRYVSNLTVSITSKNDFNTPSPFTKLLNKFVSRVMFPNNARTAFYFRPTISWNTEIVDTPGTFATSSFEGLDFEFEITESNIT